MPGSVTRLAAMPPRLFRAALAVLLVGLALACTGGRARSPRPPTYTGVLQFDYHPPVDFYPCGLDSTRYRERWAVRWDSLARHDLQHALRRQAGRALPTSRDQLFVTLVGTVSDTGHYGYLGWSAREVRVARLVRVRLLSTRNADGTSVTGERDRLCREGRHHR